jgi:hypothetical protein
MASQRGVARIIAAKESAKRRVGQLLCHRTKQCKGRQAGGILSEYKQGRNRLLQSCDIRCDIQHLNVHLAW